MHYIILLSFILHITGFVYSQLDVVMERACMYETNPKYVEWGKTYVTRFGRKSPYYLNIEGRTLVTWNNNMTIHLVFYEYLHNEYRRSFVEMRLKFCDAVNADPYVGAMLARAGIICPMIAGDVNLKNMTVVATKFPNVWPIRKAKVDVNLIITGTAVSMCRMKIYMSFLQKYKSKQT